MEFLTKNKSILVISALFIVIYSLVSLVNHYNFRTYALDLGAYTNALYDYSHFQWNDSCVFKDEKDNLLSDHFDFYLIIFSPLIVFFGTYTLLLVQVISIVAGGIGVYKLFTIDKIKSQVALFATIYFYTFFGVFSALAFDYHSNVVAAALVPWLFYFVSKSKIVHSSIFIMLIIVAKENMSLWLTFILIGLAIEHRNDKLKRNFLILGALFSGISFFVITSIIMPSISANGLYPHFNYTILGTNMREAIIHLITHPVESLKIIFINHNDSLHGNFIKIETHIILATSGLLLLFIKPKYMLMLIPIYFQKFFHDSPPIWSIGYQYNIEFAPIMAIGIFEIISTFKNKIALSCSIIVLLFSIASTIRTMDNTLHVTNKSQIRFYQNIHYKKNYDIEPVHFNLKKIPSEANVSAQSPFVPHLSLRENIYQFPIIKDADYIVLSSKESTYPLSNEEFLAKVAELEKSQEWEKIYSEDVTILKRIHSH